MTLKIWLATVKKGQAKSITHHQMRSQLILVFKLRNYNNTYARHSVSTTRSTRKVNVPVHCCSTSQHEWRSTINQNRCTHDTYPWANTHVPKLHVQHCLMTPNHQQPTSHYKLSLIDLKVQGNVIITTHLRSFHCTSYRTKL